MAVPNRQAAASLSPDFPPPHRLVRQNDFQSCSDFASRITEGEGVAMACRRMIWCFPALFALVRVGGVIQHGVCGLNRLFRCGAQIK